METGQPRIHRLDEPDFGGRQRAEVFVSHEESVTAYQRCCGFSGQCTSAIDSTVMTTINANATRTFAIFVQGNGNVPFDPAGNRVFVRFKYGGSPPETATFEQHDLPRSV